MCIRDSSTTKYMDGHASAVGGCIVDSGRFDWTKYPDKFPGLCTPDESYHGVTYAERFGLEGAYITKATAQLMRDLGSIQAPQNAYYLDVYKRQAGSRHAGRSHQNDLCHRRC